MLTEPNDAKHRQIKHINDQLMAYYVLLTDDINNYHVCNSFFKERVYLNMIRLTKCCGNDDSITTGSNGSSNNINATAADYNPSIIAFSIKLINNYFYANNGFDWSVDASASITPELGKIFYM